MDIESNIIQEEKPECTSDMFELQHWDFPSIQQDIVAMAVSSHFVYSSAGVQPSYERQGKGGQIDQSLSRETIFDFL